MFDKKLVDELIGSGEQQFDSLLGESTQCVNINISNQGDSIGEIKMKLHLTPPAGNFQHMLLRKITCCVIKYIHFYS